MQFLRNRLISIFSIPLSVKETQYLFLRIEETVDWNHTGKVLTHSVSTKLGECQSDLWRLDNILIHFNVYITLDYVHKLHTNRTLTLFKPMKLLKQDCSEMISILYLGISCSPFPRNTQLLSFGYIPTKPGFKNKERNEMPTTHKSLKSCLNIRSNP